LVRGNSIYGLTHPPSTRPSTHKAVAVKIVRSIIAVVVGYLVFALSAFAFFRLSGQPPHQEAPPLVMLSSIAIGVVSALLGGYAAAWLAQRRPLAHGVAVAAVLALGATVSLLSTIGHGAIWSQTAALLLMAPSAVLGGWIRERQVRRT
jgi:O-antigen/teichoic acid export membrane protein